MYVCMYICEKIADSTQVSPVRQASQVRGVCRTRIKVKTNLSPPSTPQVGLASMGGFQLSF